MIWAAAVNINRYQKVFVKGTSVADKYVMWRARQFGSEQKYSVG